MPRRILFAPVPIGMLCLLMSTAVTAADDGVELSDEEGRLVGKVNRERDEQDLPELKVDAKLTAAARKYAEHLDRTGKVGHTADGKNPAQRVKEEGYAFRKVNENMARHGGDAGDIMWGWRNSEGHRRTMFDGDFTECGVAHVGRYWVMVFARPR